MALEGTLALAPQVLSALPLKPWWGTGAALSSPFGLLAFVFTLAFKVGFKA